MCIKVAIPYADLDGEAPETTTLVTDILDTRAVAIFWFATSLVEEIGKTDSTSMKQLSSITPFQVRTR